MHFIPAAAERQRCREPHVLAGSTDGETRTRTGDTTIFSRVLYQLSYLARMGNARGALIPMQPAGTGTIGQWQPVGTSSW